MCAVRAQSSAAGSVPVIRERRLYSQLSRPCSISSGDAGGRESTQLLQCPSLMDRAGLEDVGNKSISTKPAVRKASCFQFLDTLGTVLKCLKSMSIKGK